MVSLSAATQSARTVALVLAVLGYRRRLRRRDRWSQASSCWRYQDRALRRLREHAYQKSRFYHDFHDRSFFGAAVSTPRADQADTDGELRFSRYPSRSPAGRC